MTCDRQSYLIFCNVQFYEKLNAIEKNYELRDDDERKFLDIKLINLNKHTLPLYKRLDEKNREVFSKKIKDNH